MVQLVAKNEKFGINLPTELNEIQPAYLAKCVSQIKLAENYTILAMAMRVKLSELCMTISNKNTGKEPTIGVVSLIAGYNIPENNVGYNIGDVAVISNEDLQRGTNINTPSNIAYTKLIDYLARNNDLIKEILTGSPVDANGVDVRNAYVYVLQFRIVPVCDIKAATSLTINADDEYRVELS